jgi:hypothetical protein
MQHFSLLDIFFSVPPSGCEHEEKSFIMWIAVIFALSQSHLGFLRELFESNRKFRGIPSCFLLDAGISMINTQQYEKEKSGVDWM